MKLAIIGCGYVGSALAKYWKKKGHFLSIATRSSEKIPLLSSYAHRVALLSDVESILEDAQGVLVAAAPSHSSSFEEAYLSLAHFLLPLVPPTAALLYTSSTSVYGDHQGHWVTEDSPLSPATAQAHILCQTETHWLKRPSTHTLIFRLGQIYGPHREWKEKIQQMTGHKIPGTGNSFTNTIHLDDIVSALDFALHNSLTGIFNLVQDSHYVRKEFYSTLCTKWHLPPVEWDPTLPSHHGGNKRVSNEKIKSKGFHFQYQDAIESYGVPTSPLPLSQ